MGAEGHVLVLRASRLAENSGMKACRTDRRLSLRLMKTEIGPVGPTRFAFARQRLLEARRNARSGIVDGLRKHRRGDVVGLRVGAGLAPAAPALPVDRARAAARRCSSLLGCGALVRTAAPELCGSAGLTSTKAGLSSADCSVGCASLAPILAAFSSGSGWVTSGLPSPSLPPRGPRR